jgi:hypothetical protein
MREVPKKSVLMVTGTGGGPGLVTPLALMSAAEKSISEPSTQFGAM